MAYFSSGEKATAVIPSSCPWGVDGECWVSRHSERRRASGPPFPLVVAKCREHGRHFTLYPAGWVPYSRVALIDVDGGTGQPRSPAWRATLFAAAVCLVAGRLWPELSVAAPGCGRTQWRRIERCGRVLGLDDARGWEHRAGLLQVPLASMRDARQQWGRSRRRRIRGPTVAAVLDVLVVDESSWWRLLRCGSEAGLWGRAWTTDSHGVLGRLFRA